MSRTSDANFQCGRWLSSPPPGEEVVISGISGRLPASHNIAEFRDNLFSKTEMIKVSPRWDLNHPEIPKRNGTIYDLDRFDSGFFGVHHRQANIMDPLIRLHLETAIEAILDAGINPHELAGTKTGVFVSVCWSDTENLTLINITEKQSFALTGYLKSLVAHRLSYHLKLRGPSFIADTACSSSMNALDAALRAIRSGKCESAIVGGANLLLHPGNTLQFFRLGVLSKEGRCKVFDQDASGYVRGETIATIFLQKAKDAKRIYAQVINTKVNSDGFKPQGITFPSTNVQKVLMTEIYEDSNINPSELSFMEAHGTGTQVGDPQEVEALDNALAKHRTEPLLVGSVKCSVGHTEPASGLCSIFKVLIAMETGLIAPNINIDKIKEGMEGFEQGRMSLVTELTPLEGEEAIVGINNFGFGGNNAHTILRRFKKVKVNGGIPEDDLPRLVCVSGRSEEAVRSLLEDINSRELDVEYIALIHQIYKRDIEQNIYRGYTIASKSGPIKTSSVLYNYNKLPLYVLFGELEHNFRNLALQLLQFPVFNTTISKINTILAGKRVNLLDIFTSKDNSLLGAISVQIGLVDLLKSLQIFPNGVYGDSWGKLVSAYYYDVISLEDTALAAFEINQKPSSFESNLLFEKLSKWKPNSKRDYIINTNKVHTIRDDSSTHESLLSALKDSVVLNISDTRLNNKDVFVSNSDFVDFLDIVGRLFEQGQDPHLDKLYPQIEFPVSRGTRMISPLLKWKHDKSWYTYKFTRFMASDAEQQEFNISCLDETQKYIQGHVIDGRNLVPATEYLNLVWDTYAQSRRLLKNDVSVVFENCRFIRAVTMPPKTGFVVLLVAIQQGTGMFEVLEKNTLVVSGRIYADSDISSKSADLKPVSLDTSVPTKVLEQDEIYRELYLRGYNYSGLFKGIVKCNIDATSGLIKWEDNWSTFMDKMLQMKILQIDSRMLYVPVAIQKLTIDVARHQEIVDNLAKNSLLPVSIYTNANIIKAGGIEICGLSAKSISKKKQRLEPVLEKYEFAPNSGFLDMEAAIRVNVQIILENSLESNFKAVELVDDLLQDSDFLLPSVCNVLDDVPVVTPNLTISTKKELEDIPGVNVEPVILTTESKFLLIVGSKLLQRANLQQQILFGLNPKGFVLTREEVNYEPKNLDNVVVVTEFVVGKEKLIMFKISEPVSQTYFEVSSEHFRWIPDLQKALKTQENIVVYSHNTRPDGLLGFINCIRREPGGAKIKCFFFMDDDAVVEPRHYPEQLKKNLAINVFKSKTWGTYRHFHLDELQEVEVRHCYANVGTRGDLSTMKWFAGSLTEDTPLVPGYGLVYPYFVSVNFKDIMLSTGRINVDVVVKERIKQDCVLGFEYSGRDVSGRRVCGIVTSSAMATFIIGDHTFLWEIPERLSLCEAASIPVVYATVLYGLVMVARLKPGESILIHSATGGIGLAALNVCLHYKCNVFVTVGTKEKREFLKKHYPQIPESNIGNSRDTTFETMIKTQTNNKGVDLVLNSLTEEKLMASVRCLARGGRFVEIGKFDLANDNTLNLMLLEKGSSYHGVMLDTILEASEAVKNRLHDLLQEGLDSGIVKPLPITTFERDEIEPAYRHMMTGNHIGKIVIKLRDEEEQKVLVPKIGLSKAYPKFNCAYNKSYVIIGGLGGVGMELADWLVLRGATKLVLVSRSGVQNGYQTQRINIWKSYGVHVEVSLKDVTTKQGCLELIQDATKLAPIDAVFNLAVVLKDNLFEDQNENNFLTSLAPKALSTQYLDEITRQLCPNLRYFVVFSSVSCGRGNMGQTNYGMANSIMERICERRKIDGFPALAIQWGAIGEVGLVAKMQKENRELVIGGTLQQKISSCLDALDKFLNQSSPVVSSMVVAEKHKRSDGLLSPVEAVAQVLGIKNMKTVSPHVTLAELGMDSMMGTEIVQLLEKDFDMYVTAKDIRSLTFAKLTEMDAERKVADDENKQKIQFGTERILQYLPTNRQKQLLMTRMESQLQENEVGELVFILSGVDGDFQCFETLSKSLNAHVYAIAYSYNKPEERVEEIALTLFPHVEKMIGDRKSFTLISYSFGATVGIELARLLESKNHFGKLILVDGSPTYLLSALKRKASFDSEAEFQTDVLLIMASLVIPLELLAPHREKLLKCASFVDRVELSYDLVPSDLVDREKLDKQGALGVYNRFNALIRYKCNEEKKIKTKTYLFKAKYSLAEDEEDYQLSKVCESLKGISTFEADHVTILHHPDFMSSVREIVLS